jgi:uncharacterized repeat protein (TIGR02543 family)
MKTKKINIKKLAICCMLTLIVAISGFMLLKNNASEKTVSAATVTRGVQVGDVLGIVNFSSLPNVLEFPSDVPFHYDYKSKILLTFEGGLTLETRWNWISDFKGSFALYGAGGHIETFATITNSEGVLDKPTVWSLSSYDFGGRKVTSVNDASVQQVIKVAESTTIPLPADPTKAGYTFVGWYFDSAFTQAYDGSPIYEDTALYAKFTINQYTVSFTTNGGSSVNAITQNYNSSISKPSDPTKTGYTFAGWYKDSALTMAQTFPFSLGTANVTLYAKFTINQYTVSFNTNGGSSVNAITQNYNTSISKPTDPTKTGYNFGGWYTDSALTTAQTFPYNMGAANTTLYAKWNANPMTVTINYQNANASDTVIVNYGLKLTAPANPTFTGHVFGGWFLDSECTQVVDFNTTIIEDITIYAKWTWQMFTVTFYVEGEIYHTQQVEYGTVFQVAP